MVREDGRRKPKSFARPGSEQTLEEVRAYWNEHIHDLAIARHPAGSKDFFDELEAYRFEKLDYLPRVVDFTAYAGRELLEVGCGVGTDLLRFACGGAVVTGIDLAEVSIDLAKKNFEAHGVSGDLRVMDGEELEFDDARFDVVYGHGVLQYTGDAERMVGEIHRVLRPNGKAILMVYNRYSWLSALSAVSGVRLEHEDAPVFRTYSIPEFKRMLSRFSKVEVIPERFPVRTRLHRGKLAALYNAAFVSAFNLVPRPLVRPLGRHLMRKAMK